MPDLRSYTPQPVYTPDKRREHNVARLTLCTRTRLLLDSLRYSDQLRLFSMIHNELRTDVIRTEDADCTTTSVKKTERSQVELPRRTNITLP